MDNLQYLGAFFVNRWTTSFAGGGMASMLVWYLAPLVPGFEGYLARSLLILGLVVVWAAANGAIRWVRRRRETALAKGLTEDAAAGEASADGRDIRTATQEEVARLRERVTMALKRLRKGRMRPRGGAAGQPLLPAACGPPSHRDTQHHAAQQTAAGGASKQGPEKLHPGLSQQGGHKA